MHLRLLSLPLAFAAALAFAPTEAAHASPASPALSGAATLPMGGVRVGVGVAVPIGGHWHSGRYYHSAYEGGYWVQTGVQSYVLREHVGFDAYGRAVYADRVVQEPVYQWVPVQRVVYRPARFRPVGLVSLGFRFRL
jgi:hypothetical protein